MTRLLAILALAVMGCETNAEIAACYQRCTSVGAEMWGIRTRPFMANECMCTYPMPLKQAHDGETK
jgi:hypothetical protein